MDNSGSLINLINLDYALWLEDILVIDKNSIFILDSGARIVYEINDKGSILKEYKVPKQIEIPTGLGTTSDGKVFVDQAQDIQALITNEALSQSDYSSKEIKISETTGGITFIYGQDIKEFVVPFEESFGGLKVNSVNESQIIYTKTEVADTARIMAELHVYVANHNGETIGAVRIPHLDIYNPSRHLIRVDNNHIYLLSPSDKELSIIELKPGKDFEKKLSSRILEFDRQVANNEIKLNMYSPKNDITANNGPNGYLHRADASARADRMINYSWKVSKLNKSTTYGPLPDYVKDAADGATLTGIPYAWGGANGHDVKVNSSWGVYDTFGTLQTAGRQTGNISYTHSHQAVGLDCSGFVQLAWYRTDNKYGTSTIGNIASNITKAQIKNMDALNSPTHGHIVLVRSHTSTDIYTKEATFDGYGQKAKNYVRTWAWADKNGYYPIRYNRIVDDGGSLPIVSKIE